MTAQLVLEVFESVDHQKIWVNANEPNDLATGAIAICRAMKGLESHFGPEVVAAAERFACELAGKPLDGSMPPAHIFAAGTEPPK